MTLQLDIRNLDLDTPEGRPLIRGLHVRLEHERVAIIGRNGVGKSTVLRAIAGETRAAGGTIMRGSHPWLVPQRLDPEALDATVARWAARMHHDPAFAHRLRRHSGAAGLPRPLAGPAPSRRSQGQQRKLALLAARLVEPRLLLLDEPSQDLDAAGSRWLRAWLSSWPTAVLVVSHDRDLLAEFEHFVTLTEAGCRYHPGPLSHVEEAIAEQQRRHEQRYARRLNTLAQKERHNETVLRRRARKKNVGRLHELRRCTSRARLNDKRGYAQQSQAKAAKIRDDRIEAVRSYTRACRRALAVQLPLDAQMPALPAPSDTPLVRLEGLTIVRDGHALIDDLSLALGRERLAVVGANGSGKTSLLRVLRGEARPHAGTATVASARLGAIAQGAVDWCTEESVLDWLARESSLPSIEAAAQWVVAHRFPLPLAERPLQSLSPGERLRAAVLCLTVRQPAIELLVVDEPTDSLDRFGRDALVRALAAWPGGLVVASHDREFLARLGIDRWLHLHTEGHRLGGPHL